MMKLFNKLFSRRQFLKSTAAAGVATLGYNCLQEIFIPKARAEIIPGEIQRHDDVLTWWSYVPKGLEPGQKANILLQAGGAEDDYEDNINRVKGLMEVAMQWSDNLGMPQVGIAFPRGDSEGEYTVIFPKESFSGLLNPVHTNPHEKVNDIMDIFMEQLDKKGFVVNPRVYISGFSNSGSFAQKYSLIMPERVSAIAAGGMGGSFTMPLSEYDNPDSANDGRILDWEVGINNLESLVGRPFNDADYRDIFQYIFHGSEDYKEMNSFLRPSGTEMYTADEISFLKSEFGDTDPVIEGNIIKFLKKFGYDQIEYEVWAGFGHEVTPEMREATFDFFENHMEVPDLNKSPEVIYGSSDGGGGGGCYAATHLMENGRLSQAELSSLYGLRDRIKSGDSLIHRAGQKGIDIYYSLSPRFVDWLEKSPMEDKIDRILKVPVRMSAMASNIISRLYNN